MKKAPISKKRNKFIKYLKSEINFVIYEHTLINFNFMLIYFHRKLTRWDYKRHQQNVNTTKLVSYSFLSLLITQHLSIFYLI